MMMIIIIIIVYYYYHYDDDDDDDDDEDEDEALNSRGLARATTTRIIIVSLSSKVPSFKLRWGSIIISWSRDSRGGAWISSGPTCIHTHTPAWIDPRCARSNIIQRHFEIALRCLCWMIEGRAVYILFFKEASLVSTDHSKIIILKKAATYSISTV